MGDYVSYIPKEGSENAEIVERSNKPGQCEGDAVQSVTNERSIREEVNMT